MSCACAAGAWLVGDQVVLRALVAAAAAATVVGAVLTRRWDRVAGKRVAELTGARLRDEWRTDERVAELESDLEEHRELRAALDSKVRAQRAELSRLRNEHADLLRRYATAETGRASALEGRRLLALESGTSVKELPVAQPGAVQPAADRPGMTKQPNPPTPGALKPAAPDRNAYRRADEALRQLVRNGARQHVQGLVEEARRRHLAEREAEGLLGKHSAAAGNDTHSRPAAESAESASRDADAAPFREHHTVPAGAAVAVVPYAAIRRPASRVEGEFDYFGTEALLAIANLPRQAALTAAAPEDDLADVVGAEVFAEHQAQQARERERDLERPGVAGEVIDLTEHDEIEEFDVRELRAHSS